MWNIKLWTLNSILVECNSFIHYRLYVSSTSWALWIVIYILYIYIYIYIYTRHDEYTALIPSTISYQPLQQNVLVAVYRWCIHLHELMNFNSARYYTIFKLISLLFFLVLKIYHKTKQEKLFKQSLSNLRSTKYFSH